MAQIFYLQVPAERKYLALIRDFIYRQVNPAGPSATFDVDCLVQAVDEAATNIMVHGYQCGPGTIEIEVCSTGPEWWVTLRDNAPGFDPTRVPDPDLDLPLEMRPVGGLGIHLIRKCVDKTLYSVPPGGGNQLTLMKHIRRDCNLTPT